MGAWEPVRRRLKESGDIALPEIPRGLLLGGLCTALLGASSIALAVLGLSQLYVGKFGLAAMLLSGATVGAIVFRSAFSWHMLRLQAD